MSDNERTSPFKYGSGFGEWAKRETMKSILKWVEDIAKMDDWFKSKEEYKDWKEYIDTLTENAQAEYIEETFNLTLKEVE